MSKPLSKQYLAPVRPELVPDIVILGGGSVVTEYYLPALAVLGMANSVRVIEPDQAILDAIKAAFPATCVVQNDYASFLAEVTDARGSALIVALPNHLHVDAVRLGLERGFHVLCEKPLALTAADCLSLTTLAEARNAILAAAMVRRHLPSLKLLRQMLDGGELGQVRSIEVWDCQPFQWRPKSLGFFAPSAGGVLADMGVHYLDYLDTIVGALQPVSYFDDSLGGLESNVEYELRAGDIPVKLRLSRTDPAGAFLRIDCERGDVSVSKSNDFDVVVTLASGASRVVRLEQPFESGSLPTDLTGCFCALLADFTRAIAGKQNQLATGRDAGRAAGLIEWAYANRSKMTGTSSLADSQTPKRPPRPDVLLTGGSGFIGGHLAVALDKMGHSIRAAVRSPANCANLARLPVELKMLDLLDRQAVDEASEGVRVVYHLAYGRDGDNAWRVTVEGTKNVVEAAIKSGAEAVVILSTMYVFGFPEGNTPIDETFPYAPYGGTYGASKAAMEKWCLDRARSSGKTRIVVLNPTCVFGPEGIAYTTLPLKLAKEGGFCWVDGGSGTCNYVYVANLVDAIIRAAQTNAAHGRRFIISDGSMTWREFLTPFVGEAGEVSIDNYSNADLIRLNKVASAFRLRDLFSALSTSQDVRNVLRNSKTLQRIRPSLAQMFNKKAARVAEFGRAGSGNGAAGALPPAWLADLYGGRRAIFSSMNARDVLGWKPLIGASEATMQTVQWLRKTGRSPQHPPHFNNAIDGGIE